MIHARADYDRFQDPLNKIGQDEPVFLMRARDDAFLAILNFAIEEYRKRQAAEVVALLERHVDRTKAWQATHGVRTADVPLSDAHLLAIGYTARLKDADFA